MDLMNEFIKALSKSIIITSNIIFVSILISLVISFI